jgi:hypothetical protein
MANPRAFTAQQIERFERGEGFYFRRWDMECDPKQTAVEAIFAPGYFKSIAEKLGAKFSKNDIIRIRATDASYDFSVTVASIKGDEVVIRLHPKISRAILEAAEKADPTITPQVAAQAKPTPALVYHDTRLPTEQQWNNPNE